MEVYYMAVHILHVQEVFYIVIYYINWEKTSWIYSMCIAS